MSRIAFPLALALALAPPAAAEVVAALLAVTDARAEKTTVSWGPTFTYR